MGADADLRQLEDAVAVDVDARIACRDALKEAEQQRGDRDIHGLPVAEDHNGQCEEAEARHVAVRGAVCRSQRIDEAAHARERAGNGRARVAHLIDVDAQGVRRLRIFAARAQTQAEARLIEQDRQDNEEQNADIGRQVDLVDEGLAEEAEIRALVDAERRLFDHEPARRVAREHLERILVGNDADEEQHECGGHQVERRAADGLVGAQVDGGEAQKQGEQRTEGRRHQHREQLHALKRDPVAALLEGEDRVARL